MGKLIIDGKSVYEVDENCLKRRRIPKECQIYEKIEQMRKREEQESKKNKS